MRLRLTLLAFLTVSVIGVILPGEARAQSGLQQTLFRGMTYIGNRSFISNPQNGPLFNNNIFTQRIERNLTGGGWTYEHFRFFGTDTFDNPNTLDLGPIKIQLGVDPTFVQNTQPVGIHNRIGYTTRLIPEVFFESETGQRGFDQFSGQTTFRPTPIRYDITVNTGVQDFEWTGNAFVQTDGRINALGFYDFNMQIVNVGNHRADGFVVHDEQVTDFDTGPISLSGHILFDAFASLAQAFGQTDSAAFPRSISGATGSINSKQKVEDIMARIQAGEEVSDAEMSFLLQEMLVTAFRSDPIGFMQNGVPQSIPGFEGLELSPSEEQPEPQPRTQVPEPGTLILVGSAMAAVGLLRKKKPRNPSGTDRPIILG